MLFYIMERSAVRAGIVRPSISSFRKIEQDPDSQKILVPVPTHDVEAGLFCSLYKPRPYVREELIGRLMQAGSLAKAREFGGIKVLMGYKENFLYKSGGVVDVMLCDSSGGALNMGSPLGLICAAARTKPRLLDVVSINRRKILCNAMEVAGFVNDPRFWWRFHYGTRRWAWGKGYTTYSFGPIKAKTTTAQQA